MKYFFLSLIALSFIACSSDDDGGTQTDEYGNYWSDDLNAWTHDFTDEELDAARASFGKGIHYFPTCNNIQIITKQFCQDHYDCACGKVVVP